jgi:hypothetical protein
MNPAYLLEDYSYGCVFNLFVQLELNLQYEDIEQVLFLNPYALLQVADSAIHFDFDRKIVFFQGPEGVIKDSPLLPIWAIVLIVVGSLLIIGGIAYYVC